VPWPLHDIVVCRGFCTESTLKMIYLQTAPLFGHPPHRPALPTLLRNLLYPPDPPVLRYMPYYIGNGSCKGQLGLYTILPLPILYGVWHTQGLTLNPKAPSRRTSHVCECLGLHDDDQFTPTKHLTPPPHHSSRPAAAHTDTETPLQ